MEITNKNLQSSLPEVLSSINDAIFVSIDTEFSGLYGTNYPTDTIGRFDSPSEAYAKLRRTSEYVIFQFGLCTFHINPTNPSKVTHRAYNFYIFPSSAEFSCQTSCMRFLADHEMDFNKVFRDGIVSLTPAEQKAQTEAFKEKQEIRRSKLRESQIAEPKSSDMRVAVPEEHKETVQSAREQIEALLKTEVNQEEVLGEGRFNSFVRLLLHQMVDAEFAGRAFLSTRLVEKRNRETVVLRGGKEEQLQHLNQELLLEEQRLSECAGFLSVLRAIKTSGKPMVGHNMMLDVIHTVHQFLQPLPEDLDHFKKLVSSEFPKIIDTKLMASLAPFVGKVSSTVLSALAEDLSKQPFSLEDIAVAEGALGYSRSCEKGHEAGYDAYLTGICFLAMANHLDSTTEKTSMANHAPLHSPALDPFFNKIPYAMQDDAGFIDLRNKEIEPSREHVFHLKVPTEWRTSDVSKLFSPFGGVWVSWQNSEECLVSLNKVDQASKVKRTLSKGSTKGSLSRYKLQTFSEYKLQEKRNIHSKYLRRPAEEVNQQDSSMAKKRRCNGNLESSSNQIESQKNTTFTENSSWD